MTENPIGRADDRRVAFGEAAEQYDAARPGYPDELVTDVLEFAGPQGVDALEVGAGTGKATLAFAAHGITLTCLEPDPRMAAVLARHCAAMPHVTIENVDFESRAASGRRFGLLLSGQSWHWVDPEVRWRRARELLLPGGAIALFWNDWLVADEALRHELRAVHHRHLHGLPPHSIVDVQPRESVMAPNSWVWEELRDQEDFTDLEHRLYLSRHTRTTAGTVDLLSSLSSYLILTEETRRALFSDVSRTIDGHGGGLELETRTGLFLARTTA
ncbi:bifunctional 2-polyprenyl-6-hydroxyphenol methylase/3-demethylubiquinol 3-O-methyltransferase UbiG [Streptomyces sp. UNOB3_S3]|uniref:class I SAM-dependent methyltransferase n=1 Tax=Streptomyces sp. UNOB3_S3 TaxID=2871682 RepID=UPI001E292F32|nr:class I SAM-dependent methyltransferase [Streptomyces sp. UNOB3_S3]MCC3777257.1 class I SAM-dependent methyltransferase [Streptomyces sp. UNOB3_S3]